MTLLFDDTARALSCRIRAASPSVHRRQAPSVTVMGDVLQAVRTGLIGFGLHETEAADAVQRATL
jgi:hypothetical protein